MAGSRTAMGDDWLPAFLESPVWRFALPRGLCGERAALGLMLPSVDRAGRYFPLTFAALVCRCAAAGRQPAGGSLAGSLRGRWPRRAGRGRRAGTDERHAWDWPHRRNDQAGTARSADDLVERWLAARSGGRLSLRGLPDAATYATMLGAQAELEPSNKGLGGEAWERPS